MKKFLKAVLILAVLGAVGFFGYRYYQEKQIKAMPVATETTYTEYPVVRGTLAKNVSGTGTLSCNEMQNVSFPFGVSVTDVLVEAGDLIKAGQPLLRVDTVALKTEIDELEKELDTAKSELTKLANDYSPNTYVQMPQYGRIKEVYISEHQYIEDVMAEKGSIALLSLDGWMYVDTPMVEGMEIGSKLKVKVGHVTLDGVVRWIEGDTARLTFSDAYGAEGEEVELFYQQESIGKATAHIHMPHALTTTEKGYIYGVYIEPGNRKWEGNRICYLINVPMSEEYEELTARAEKLSAQLDEMKKLLAEGTVNAEQDGIVASVAELSAAAQEAHTTLLSLYVGTEKKMVVSVDELDITSVTEGQSVMLSMDAITDQAYWGKVSKVSHLGKSENGVTVYNVTLTVQGDERLRLGMNGTATINVEQRENVLLVPLAALNTSRGKSYVWVKGESAQADEPGVRTEVETGLSDENFVEIVSGLNEGDVILITREDNGGMNRHMPTMQMMPAGGPGLGRVENKGAAA